MHDILAVVDMDVAEPFPTLGGADEAREEVVDAGAVDWINDTREDTHLLLKTVDVEGVSGGEEEVVFGECQHETAVHVDELGSEDETLVEVGAIDGLQHHIGLDGLDFLAVVEFYPLDFDPVTTTGDSLPQGTAEGCFSTIYAACYGYLVTFHLVGFSGAKIQEIGDPGGHQLW